MLEVRENGLALRKLSGGTAQIVWWHYAIAQLRTLQGTLSKDQVE